MPGWNLSQGTTSDLTSCSFSVSFAGLPCLMSEHQRSSAISPETSSSLPTSSPWRTPFWPAVCSAAICWVPDGCLQLQPLAWVLPGHLDSQLFIWHGSWLPLKPTDSSLPGSLCSSHNGLVLFPEHLGPGCSHSLTLCLERSSWFPTWLAPSSPSGSRSLEALLNLI